VRGFLSRRRNSATTVKLFPARQLGGPGYVKAIDPAIHKMISIVPTGGTNTDNIGEYIAAGVLVVGGSFSMIEKSVMQRIIDEQDYELLAEQLGRIKRLIDERRARIWPDVDFKTASIERISEVTGRNFNL